MSYKTENEIDMDSVASFLASAVDKVKVEEDIDKLNKLKKAYKQNVPFTLRTYVAAYLTKELMSKFGMRYKSHQDRYNGRQRFDNRFDDHGKFGKENHGQTFQQDGNAEVHERVPYTHLQIDDALSATIFVSIGKSRKVFPRDLIGILINVAGIERERIGDIRVLASYSFVKMYKEDADKAIAALNGYVYRGRRLSVSYSQKKDAGDVSAENTVAVAETDVAAADSGEA